MLPLLLSAAFAAPDPDRLSLALATVDDAHRTAVMAAITQPAALEDAIIAMLSAMAESKDWERLEVVTLALLRVGGLPEREDFQQLLEDGAEMAALKVVEVRYAESADPVAAAEGYIDFIERFPTSSRLVFALRCLAHFAHLSGDPELQLMAYLGLVQAQPNSEHAPEALAQAGFLFEQRADFAIAADYYEQLAQRYPEHQSAPDALLSAAIFWESLGEPGAALSAYERCLSLWPDASVAMWLPMNIARVQRTLGQPDAALQTYRGLLATAPPEVALAAAQQSVPLLTGRSRSEQQAFWTSLPDADVIDAPGHNAATSAAVWLNELVTLHTLRSEGDDALLANSEALLEGEVAHVAAEAALHIGRAQAARGDTTAARLTWQAGLDRAAGAQVYTASTRQLRHAMEGEQAEELPPPARVERRPPRSFLVSLGE